MIELIDTSTLGRARARADRKLELTESSVLSDPARIGDVLAHLGELGIGLSLDDFGTGYSSLSHLRSLPVGEVKIDRSFVTRMHAETADAAIVHATIQLAHKLGIRVVAEGVENEQTWNTLRRLGCHLIQGYVLSQPVSPAQLEPLLSARSNDHPHAPGTTGRSRDERTDDNPHLDPGRPPVSR